MRATIPGYPIPRNRSSNRWTKHSSIEAVLSDQRDEPRGTERCLTELQPSPGCPLDQREDLVAPLPQRDQQPAARRELLDERRRHLGPAGGDENRVVGRVGTPPQGAVAQQD